MYEKEKVEALGDAWEEASGALTAERGGAEGETEGFGPSERELVEFVRHYPHVRAEEIPDSVWGRVREGVKLVDAFREHENILLREQNRSLRARLAERERAFGNRERSAGSQRGSGTGKTVSEWERAWYEE